MNKSLLLLSLLPFALVAGTLERSGSPERDSLRVRFLGTGAADWNGRDARGELRRWTSALLDGRVLVDYTATNADMIPADAHPKTVFYTHSHADHYDPDAALRLGVRQVYVNASWVEGARREFAAAAERLGLPAPDVRGLAFGESAAAEGILLTSLPANHVTDRDGEHCSMYLVEKGDVRLLYATDTGGIPGEAARIAGIDAHVRPGRPITALIMEATMGVAHADDFRIYSHSSVATVAQTLRVLQTTKRYLPAPDQKVYLTHMARTLHGTQREIAAALPEPFTPAFDGLEVTFASPRSETERIQGEIDRVSAQGGGRVVVGKGVHPCGTLYLKSGVELHLEEGAVLLGGDRPEDYDDAIPPEEVYSYADSHSNTVTRKAFIFAQGATNIAITGKGVIDCQGPRFFDRNSLLWGRFWAKPPCMRPRMVVLMRCRGIRFEDTTFKDSPVWTMWLRHCENIVAARIRVTAEQKMINSDGIDFDACRNIRVGDSYFKTGDDCLILRAIRHDADGEGDVVTENVVVSNCALNSACQGVRIGCPSDVLIRNAVFRDITFEGNNAIFADQERRYLEPGDRGRLRTRDILFENWTIRCSGCPISASIEEGVTLEDFGHMTFRNITVDSDGPIGISGNSTSLVRDMTLDGISGTIRADPPVVSRRTKDFAVMRKTVSRLAQMPAAESREAERAPYEVSWNGNVLRQQDARISSVPHNRVWPGHQRELSQTEIARFVRFDHEVAGTLEIRGDGVGRLLRHVLPLSEKASVSTEGDDGICIAISRPGAHVVEFDGLPTLHVFADPPLAPVPAPGPGGRLIRFERGEHSPGVVAPRSGDVVVLDEGAVVYGSLFVLNATNVTVTGRGIFDGSRLERSDETMRAFRRAHRLPEIDTESACFAYSVYGSEDVTISGVTFRDPPFWTLVIRNQCRRTLVDNIHIIGNWRYNSDGIDVCASRDTVIRNSFFRTFDDCVIARGPYLKGEYAPVDGMVVTNCSLYCDWGMPFKAQVQDFRGSTIQNVCMRDCRILAMRENGILLAVRYGSDLNVLRNFTFEDLEFDFFPQPYSSLQKTDGEAFVPKPMTYNTLVLSYSYSLGKNLDNQVNGPMEDPGYYHFIYEDLAFRRFKTFGEKRTLDVCLLAKVPRHEYRRVTIEDFPPFKRVGPETVWSNVVSSVEGRTGEH